MSGNKVNASSSSNSETVVSGFKVIEFNVTDPTESLYAVVTPIKNMN